MREVEKGKVDLKVTVVFVYSITIFGYNCTLCISCSLKNLVCLPTTIMFLPVFNNTDGRSGGVLLMIQF